MGNWSKFVAMGLVFWPQKITKNTKSKDPSREPTSRQADSALAERADEPPDERGIDFSRDVARSARSAGLRASAPPWANRIGSIRDARRRSGPVPGVPGAWGDGLSPDCGQARGSSARSP